MSFPFVDGVRLATVQDLHRISIVAAAAFFSSPTFQFQRPHYRQFPCDTIASYFFQYESALKDPCSMVLVAEDILEEAESHHVYKELQWAFSPQPSQRKDIVGVAGIQLKPGSSYAGQFQPADMSANVAEPCHFQDLARDQSREALDIYNAITRPVKLEYFQKIMRLSTLAVAPSYWRRGHASRLVSFCTQLADLDDAPLGISATPCGATVVSQAGFQERAVVHYPPTANNRQGENAKPGTGFELWIGVRLPRTRY